jgi:hypothetical protein
MFILPYPVFKVHFSIIPVMSKDEKPLCCEHIGNRYEKTTDLMISETGLSMILWDNLHAVFHVGVDQMLPSQAWLDTGHKTPVTC